MESGGSVVWCLEAACCVLALAAVNLMCWVPMILKLLTKKVAFMHSEVQ